MATPATVGVTPTVATGTVALPILKGIVPAQITGFAFRNGANYFIMVACRI